MTKNHRVQETKAQYTARISAQAAQAARDALIADIASGKIDVNALTGKPTEPTVPAADPQEAAVVAEYTAVVEEGKALIAGADQDFKDGKPEEAQKKLDASVSISKKLKDLYDRHPEIIRKLRENSANEIDKVADGVDKYGHAGVDVVANVAHKAVDLGTDVLNAGVDVAAGTLRFAAEVIRPTKDDDDTVKA